MPKASRAAAASPALGRSHGGARRAALTLLVAAQLASCSLFRGFSFERPSVRLTALEITHIDWSGVQTVLWLEVFNPNDYDIRTTRVEVELKLEDVDFGHASLEESVLLTGASTTTVKVPAAFAWEGIGAGARALLQRGALDYDMDARLRVTTSFGSRTLDIGTRGRVDVLN